MYVHIFGEDLKSDFLEMWFCAFLKPLQIPYSLTEYTVLLYI